jgi:hypothetical protein
LKVFVAGPRAIKTLNSAVKERLKNILNQNFTIIVGDANGIDKQVQQFCLENQYNLVKVFATNGKARNNIGQWEVENVEVPSTVKGFEYYAAKDFEMAKHANYGFMIWNGKSKGTLNNMYNLIKFNKKVLVYLTSTKSFYVIKTIEHIETLKNDPAILKNTDESVNVSEQIRLF